MPFESTHISEYWPAYLESSDTVQGLVFDDSGRVRHINRSCLQKLQAINSELNLVDYQITQRGGGNLPNRMALGLHGLDQCIDLGDGWEVSQEAIKGQTVSIAIGTHADAYHLQSQDPSSAYEIERLHNTYEKLAEKIPGFVFQFKRDVDGTFSFPFISSGFSKIFHDRIDGIRNDAEPVLTLIHGDDRADFDKSINKSARKLLFWKHTFRFVCSKGNHKWVQGIGVPEQVDDAVIWRGFIYDISDKMNFEQRLKKQQADLEEIAFLQAHEFRRPVANMLSLSDMIEVHCRGLESMDSLVDLLNMLKRSVREADEVIAKIITKTNNSKWLTMSR